MTHKKGNTPFLNEADVEQKFCYPLLTAPAFLKIPAASVHPKAYMAPTLLDKAAGKNSGYYPDYSVWIGGNPVLILEAKDPIIPSEVGFREACLYARHFNTQWPTDFNPCRFVIATNGKNLLAG